jgi:hypothetical protein
MERWGNRRQLDSAHQTLSSTSDREKKWQPMISVDVPPEQLDIPRRNKHMMPRRYTQLLRCENCVQRPDNKRVQASERVQLGRRINIVELEGCFVTPEPTPMSNHDLVHLNCSSKFDN